MYLMELHINTTVYLFNIGSANQNLKIDIYSDDYILCKYGCTEGISRRIGEHERKFKRNSKQYFKSNKLEQINNIINYYKIHILIDIKKCIIILLN